MTSQDKPTDYHNIKIQILSDLHNELSPYDFDIHHQANILVLAGDIHNASKLEKYLLELRHKTTIPIIIVTGNHEYYNSSIEDGNKAFLSINIPNVYPLQQGQVTIHGVTFLGCTLWSRILEQEKMNALRYINDYRYIKDFTPDKSTALHESDEQWLRETIPQIDGPIVIITHHLPSYSSIAGRYLGSGMNSCYASNLEDLILKNAPNLWIHGHTHTSVEYKLDNTTILCNPKGYYIANGVHENPEFEPMLIAELTIPNLNRTNVPPFHKDNLVTRRWSI